MCSRTPIKDVLIYWSSKLYWLQY